MSVQSTPVGNIASIVDEARDRFEQNATLDLEYRKEQLTALYKLVSTEEERLKEAVHKDLGISKNQVFLGAIGMIYNDLTEAMSNVKSWMSPEYPSVPLVNKMDKCQIRKDPKGTVLIIGAWNYPIQLTLVPLVGAIAAGCTAVIKPSELAVNTANLLAELIPKYMDEKAYKVVNGAIPETTEVLKQRFDHILYTGNGVVGRIVMEAASKHLTPVTLELGGKSPTIVDSDVDLGVVARRVVWGAFFNCGQTCIRPDYILCEKEQVDGLVKGMKDALTEFYGENPEESDYLGRIINERHFARVTKLIKDTKGKVVIGGTSDAATRYVAPTVVTNCKESDSLMKGENFGPVLPIVTVESMDAALKFVRKGEKPLALYLFSNSGKVQEKFLRLTSSGSMLINDVLMQATVSTLPFGGVGESGQGGYHGKFSFDMFTHSKSTMVKNLALESVNSLRYPPVTDDKLGWLKMLAVSEPTKKKFWLF